MTRGEDGRRADSLLPTGAEVDDRIEGWKRGRGETRHGQKIGYWLL